MSFVFELYAATISFLMASSNFFSRFSKFFNIQRLGNILSIKNSSPHAIKAQNNISTSKKIEWEGDIEK